MSMLDPIATGVPMMSGPPSAVVIGASTGGPPALETVLSALPADLPVPVAVCQHMPAGFTAGWAERLNGLCRIRVCEAVNRQTFGPGCVYIAPIGLHMRLKRSERGVTVRLDEDFADSLHVPSIDMLMSSAAEVFGSRALAVELTGLGSDGALGMLAVRRAGGHTIAQAPESCAAPSMPESAIQLGAAGEILALDFIGTRIRALATGGS